MDLLQSSYKSPKEEVPVHHRLHALMTDCLLEFMAPLIYCCTAAYHPLQFWPFDMQIKIPFHVSVSSSQRGAITVGLYKSRQHWPPKHGFDHMESILGHGFITTQYFPSRRLRVCLCSANRSFYHRRSVTRTDGSHGL